MNLCSGRVCYEVSIIISNHLQYSCQALVKVSKGDSKIGNEGVRRKELGREVGGGRSKKKVEGPKVS